MGKNRRVPGLECPERQRTMECQSEEDCRDALVQQTRSISLDTGADFGRKNRGSGEGGGRPQETKHEAGECKVYSVGSEWVEVIEQKVLEGEKSLVACNAGVLEKDLKVFNVTFLGLLVTFNVSKVP